MVWSLALVPNLWFSLCGHFKESIAFRRKRPFVSGIVKMYPAFRQVRNLPENA